MGQAIPKYYNLDAPCHLNSATAFDADMQDPYDAMSDVSHVIQVGCLAWKHHAVSYTMEYHHHAMQQCVVLQAIMARCCSLLLGVSYGEGVWTKYSAATHQGPVA